MMSRVCYLLAVTVSLQLLCSRSARSQVDGTLTDDQIGGSVVRAVIAKINASDIFRGTPWWQRNNPRSLVLIFLRRMAYVETADGRNSSYSGRAGGLGIWNIHKNIFNMIHTFVCDESNGLRQNLNSSILNTDWCSIEHSDMSVPMLCGIAAALRVHQVRTTIKDYTESKLHLLWRHVTGRLDTPKLEDKKSWTKKVDKLKEQERKQL